MQHAVIGPYKNCRGAPRIGGVKRLVATVVDARGGHPRIRHTRVDDIAQQAVACAEGERGNWRRAGGEIGNLFGLVPSQIIEAILALGIGYRRRGRLVQRRFYSGLNAVSAVYASGGPQEGCRNRALGSPVIAHENFAAGCWRGH